MEYAQKVFLLKIFYLVQDMAFVLSSFFLNIRNKETLTIITILIIFTLRLISWMNENKIQSINHETSRLKAIHEKLEIKKKEIEIENQIKIKEILESDDIHEKLKIINETKDENNT